MRKIKIILTANLCYRPNSRVCRRMEIIMINEIMKKIELPHEIAIRVSECDAILDYDKLQPYISLLYSRDTWNVGLDKLKEALDNDPQGIKILTVMLHCGALAYEKYLEAGIDETIYIDTMKCFTRFVNEYKISFGVYGFDRSFWTSRQISMQLFRIGELEYELDYIKENKIISLHIPSDADITLRKLRSSYAEAKKFIRRFYSEYDNAKMMCESWLLSPNLKAVLSTTSKIIGFQNSFIITEENWEAKDYLEWVFKVGGSARDDCKLEELAENTSLQKNMKKYLLNGGKIGIAAGVLMEEPFSFN